MSVNQGEAVYFKVKTDATAYQLDIYRLGYYQGNGARLVATVLPSAALPQTQPACLTDATSGLVDCGNWAVSASWVVPSNATSGIYFARLVRRDTLGASHVYFVVRSDSSRSALLFQTSDTTWQAYNDYGGWSLCGCNSNFDVSCRAFEVSYNRPLQTRAFNSFSWLFNAEYPMIRWLEANGYDVSYTSAVDTDRRGALLLEHKIFLSVGRDEYWSGNQRASVEAARAAGVHLAFFSGNEIFWKTRWENSSDGTNTPYRTLVSYKETQANAVPQPADPPIWTGAWRDPRFSPPADGGRPENELTGTLFMVNGIRDDSITVPQADGRMRFWRNTPLASMAPGQLYTTPAGTLGFAWDVDADNGFRPAGLFPLSTTTIGVSNQYLLDFGTIYGAGVATHHLSLYRHPSGAIVFGSGTAQWSWGLDAEHDNAGTPVDINMQQATVNLFADMGVQPATLQAGLIPANASTDAIAPASTIRSPADGAIIPLGTTLAITGTATDVGGMVAGVELSLDGGATWHPALGRENWSLSWTPAISQSESIKSRAVDDSGNLEMPSAGINVTAIADGQFNIWSSSAAPVLSDSGPDAPIEVGVRFTADTSGYVTGIRFYKSAGNAGPHIGSLWNATGTLLAQATFVGETFSGWQQINFAAPVPITPHTIYVASYHTTSGHYSRDRSYFAGSGVDNSPLHALADALSGGNGVFAYSAASAFPANSILASNYWVDVAFIASSSFDSAMATGAAVTQTSPLAGSPELVGHTGHKAMTMAVDPGLISQMGWLASADSQQSISRGCSLAFPATNVIDGNPSTFWHTQYCPTSAPLPHQITINLGASYSLTGLQYLARQDGCSHGWIKGYAIYVSSDGVNWGTAVATGTLNYGNLSTSCPGAGVPGPITIAFPAMTGQYIQLQALSEINGNPWSSAAEIDVIGTPVAPAQATVSTVTLSPPIVVGGTGSVQGTVNLTAIAPAGGALVTLASDNTAAATPASGSVMVPAGQTSATFIVNTSLAGAVATANISASYNGSNQAATLTVNSGSLIPQTGRQVSADSQETSCYNGAAKNAIDGNPSTMWHTQFCGASPSTPHWIQINLGASYSLTGLQYLPRQDGCSHGWIKGYAIYVSSDGVNWGTAVATGTLNYGNLSTTCPGAGVPGPITIAFPATTGQYIQLQALSEINGNPWISAAEIDVLSGPLPPTAISQQGWSVAYVDSQETRCYNGAAVNAIDGNANTMWHTQFCPASAPLPHEIQINLGRSYLLSGFQYLPRQDGCANGWIKQYEFYVSTDGVNWGMAVATGTFSYAGLSIACPGGDVPAAIQVNFTPVTGQFIRLRALSEINGNPWTSAAEINVLGSVLALGNQLVGTTSSAKGFVLTNSGITSMAISIATSGDYAQSNDCGSSLAPGSSCTIAVTFTPTALGIRPGSLSINSSSITLTGAGVANHQVNLSWTASTSAVVGYLVYRIGLSPGGLVERLNSVSIPGTSFTDTVQGNQFLYYFVTAVDSNGAESVNSNLAPVSVPF